MTTEFEEFMAENGFVAVQGEDAAFDPWSEWSSMPLEAPVVTHTEATTPDYSIPHGATTGDPYRGEITVTDVTVRDIWNQYGDATTEGQRQIQERLYAAGFYTRGTNPDNIGRPTDSLTALNRAISYYATQGVDALSALPEADMSLFEPQAAPASVVRRATEAQVYSIADTAAKNLLGRKASNDERRLAMSVIRSLETSQSQSPSGADVEAAFAEAAPGEVSARATEKTLSVFERLVRGA